MSTDRMRMLVELGPERLAEALADLASRDEVAGDTVERLLASPKEKLRNCKAKLAKLKRTRHFFPGREVPRLAYELSVVLEGIKASRLGPRAGVALVASFYEADAATLGQCDDSSGRIGDLFRYDAKELFLSFANRCEDKEWLSDLVFNLNQKDGYGVRDSLVDCAAEYLPEPVIRTLISRLQAVAAVATDEYDRRHWLIKVESLARQVKDAALFEQTLLGDRGKTSFAAHVEIATVHLECGDPHAALAWLEKISLEDPYTASDRDQLLCEVYGRLGDQERQAEVAWRIFRNGRSVHALADLLAVIGEDQRDSVIATESAAILSHPSWSVSNATFLVAAGRMADAESYLISRRDQLDGDCYSYVLPLAEVMEAGGRVLCASVIYRALLDSILRRAQTNTYVHGARYLKKLDQLAIAIADWGDVLPHADYLAAVRQANARKSSFWKRCGE